MASKKKILTSVVALGTAAALTLGGTFAWQSINQTALNEASDIVNPGGRLHDDFNGTNKDIYVENFADEDIFARVRLEELFEIVLNKGTAGEKVVPMIGTKTAVMDEDGNQKETENGNPVYDYAYEVFKEYDGIENGVVPAANVKDGTDDDATTTSWWNWTTGGSKIYMPTFNKNKDSLKADISGEYKFDTGVITDKDIEGGQYTKMDEWEADAEKTAWSVYDIDSNKADEIAQADLAAIIASGTVADDYAKNVKTVEETHFAKETGDAELISMADWLKLSSSEQVGNYWVYDTDGWVYWASPIKPATATGLLLDGIQLAGVMDDSWYYAINVTAQFCTANDVGKNNSTGFYQDEDEAPSENAEALLEKIGVTLVEDTTAPTVSNFVNGKEMGESAIYYFTISNLSDRDYPLTLSAQHTNSLNSETVKNTVTISRSEAGEISFTETEKNMHYNFQKVEAQGNGDLRCRVNSAMPGTFSVTVKDKAGNTSKALSGTTDEQTGCFVAGTQVLTPNGLVNIEDIETGDTVYAVDLTTGEKVEATVEHAWNNWTNYEGYTITAGGETITATPEHQFYVAGQWVQACELKVGDALTSMNGTDVTITAVEYENWGEDRPVYNLTVDGYHNFLITESELLVHNVTK